MTDRPAILIMQRHLAPLTGFLEGAYTVYRFWEGPPVEAREDIRAMVVAGEFELDKHLVESLPRLELIACFTAGYDGIDVDWCRERGLPVTHAPGVNHEDVADHALGLLISARHRLSDGAAVRGAAHAGGLVGAAREGGGLAPSRVPAGSGARQRRAGGGVPGG